MQITGFSPRIIREQGHLIEQHERSTASIERVAEIVAKLQERRIVRMASELRDFAEEFRLQVERVRPTARTQINATVAGKPIALDLSTRVATLSSTAEINSDTAAFTPRAPVWKEASTSEVDISGLYDASLGTTSLAATVINAGERGVSNGRLMLSDDNSGWSAILNINKNHPPNQVYTTNIGLNFTFGLGTFVLGDTFAIDLQVGADVEPDPAGTFDASQGTDANLESGQFVTGGEFSINDTVITVNADDSIYDVLTRINASIAGVTASYDADREKIDLVQNTPGAVPTIALSDDTSGFIAAVKLDNAVVVPGRDADLDRPIKQLASLKSIEDGILIINGANINLNTASDSLNDLLATINQSSAGVIVEFQHQNVLTIRSKTKASFTLDSNGTNFFEAFGITPGTFEGSSAQSNVPRPPEPSLYRLSRGANELIKRINALVSSTALAARSDLLKITETQVGQLLQKELATPLRALNLRTNLLFNSEGSLLSSGLNQAELRRGLRWRFDQVRDVFSDAVPNGKNGFLKKLVQLLDETFLAPRSSGALVDEFV